MELITINPKRPSADAVKRALAVLMAGGVVAYPTDTAYGLAVDATNEEAIGKIFVMKRRVQKPLPVLVANLTMAKRYVVFTPTSTRLAKQHWPGRLTLILPFRNTLPAALILGKPGLAIRHSGQPVAEALVRGLDRPITCTSANISGKGVLYSGQDVARHFRSEPVQPDLILDAGEIPEEPPSTIVDCTQEPATVLRQGSVQPQLRGAVRNALRPARRRR